MKGSEVKVTIIEVDPNFKKIVLSMERADQFSQLKAIHLGALMWGEIRRIEEFGAFVGLEGTRISGLLHISNISRARVESVQVRLWLESPLAGDVNLLFNNMPLFESHALVPYCFLVIMLSVR